MKNRSKTAIFYRLPVLTVSILLASGFVNSSAADSPTSDDSTPEVRLELLKSLSLEDLINTEVTSVSKKKEKLFQSAAAVHVISNDDIRKSGARNIPDALRLAPGLFVGQNDGNKWAIGSRGFSDRYADKLLVLIDGRSVYTSHFGGVFWENFAYPLDDIDRIEVIRGPGGSLYGDNAVNGVINIITKDAHDTQGFYATGGGGTLEKGFGTLRYGTSLGDVGAFRAYLDYSARGDFPLSNDSREHLQGGLRADWIVEQNRFMISADKYHGDMSETILAPAFPGPPTTVPTLNNKQSIGHNVVARWIRELENEGELKVQAYYDYAKQTGLLRQREEKWDIELQHRLKLGTRHDFMYGIGYRLFPARQDYSIGFISYSPQSTRLQKFSSFIQDEISFLDGDLKLTLGSKVEWWDAAGTDLQPNARISWAATEKQTVWAAVSRAVLTPSLNDRFVTIFPLAPGVPLTGIGNPNSDSASMISYEIGYRATPTDKILFDIAAFYSDYRDLSSGRFIAPGVLQGSGNAKASSVGGELSVNWQAADKWRLSGGYSVASTDVNDPVRVLFGQPGENPDPDHQIQFRSSMQLTPELDLDVLTAWVDQLANGSNPAYVDLDVRIAWRPLPEMELAIVGQNLISPRRREAPTNPFLPILTAPVPRGVYAQLSYRF